MELIFNPCGEFRWSLEGPVSQIHSPHLHAGASGIFSDLLMSVQMLKRVWGAETTESYHTYSSLVKLQPWFLRDCWGNLPLGRTAALVPEFAVKDLPLGRTLWWWWIRNVPSIKISIEKNYILNLCPTQVHVERWDAMKPIYWKSMNNKVASWSRLLHHHRGGWNEMNETSVEKWWNEIHGREKPTKTLLTPRNPHGVTEMQRWKANLCHGVALTIYQGFQTFPLPRTP